MKCHKCNLEFELKGRGEFVLVDDEGACLLIHCPNCSQGHKIIYSMVAIKEVE